jgi:hypothetical protein
LACWSCRFSFRDLSNVSPRTGFESVIASTCRKASWLVSRFGTVAICDLEVTAATPVNDEMKTLLSVLGFLVISTAVEAQEPSGSASAAAAAVGRYQVVSVGVAGLSTLVKIDTQTGQAWEFFPGAGKDGQFRPFWREILTEGSRR